MVVRSRQESVPGLDTFLKAILRSGIWDRRQLQEILEQVPREQREDARALADQLVKSGRLSRFQAHKLLQGKSLGLVLGPFQVLAPIGKGGTSTVYLARDVPRKCLVALKILPPKRAREEARLLARFRREMELCQRVSHPNLAQTYEAGECQGVNYIAMEFIPGRSLYRLVTDDGPLTVSRAARLFAEAAEGLEHAHGRGLIHRDLKPSNMLVTPRDHAKIVDLGLALIEGEAPTDHRIVGGQGYVVGTMDYIAPEQADDASKADARSDIYGLGCTLYFALTCRPPFPGGTSLQKIRSHRLDPPTPVWQLNSTVPLAFIELLERMMAKQPDERPRSAEIVRDQLLAWVGEDRAGPADQAGDSHYQKAVAAIESVESASELTDLQSVPLPPNGQPDRAHTQNLLFRGHAHLIRMFGARFYIVLGAILALGSFITWIALSLVK